jgi:steroid 5-alpha reductase family enzyme
MRKFTLFIAAVLAAFAAALALASGGYPFGFLASAAPYAIVVPLAFSMATVAFAFGPLTGDYSWVDRLWSIAPVLFAWIFALSGTRSHAAYAAAVLVTVWGARLTSNFARRGGYSGTEDYRWSVLRGCIKNRAAWQLFNAFFICACQMSVMVLFSSPVARISSAQDRGLTPAFLGALLLALCFIAFETTADVQQWKFHERKAAAARGDAERGKDPEIRRGFLASGLFRYSRHPAYFGELGFWWSIYLAGCAAGGSLLHWTIIGPLALSAIFAGSTRFTESISASKYEDYAEYQRSTSAIVPWLPRGKAINAPISSAK